MLPSMLGDYAMKTNDIIHAASERRQWNAMTACAIIGMVPRERERQGVSENNATQQ